MARNYWMVAYTPEQYQVSRERGFSVLGMGRPQKKRTQRMEVGDRVLFYVTGLRVLAATATVDSTFFEDHTPIWPHHDERETLPWRVRLRPEVVLEEAEFIDARLVAPRMDYVRKWTPEQWPLAFTGLLHLIPKGDFLMLEAEMRKARAMRPPPGRLSA